MSKELLDFMTWVNQDKELGYTPIGIERIVNRYTNPKEKQKMMNNEKYYQIIDDCYKNWISSDKCYKFRRNLYVQPTFEILSVNEVNTEEFSHINSAGYYGFEKDGIEELWVDFSKLINSKHLEKFILDGFIYKIKTDPEFSERWGLKIEERKLSDDERYNLLSDSEKKSFIVATIPGLKYGEEIKYSLDTFYPHIPTRQIRLTHNETKIEIYV